MIERTFDRVPRTQVVELHMGDERTHQMHLDLRPMVRAFKDYVGVLATKEALEQVEIPGTGVFTRVELVEHSSQYGELATRICGLS